MTTSRESVFLADRPIKTILAVVAIAACAAGGAETRNIIPPQAPLVIESSDLPQLVTDTKHGIHKSDKAISIYHDLRSKLGLSHTVFATWLGLKRRSLYNWLDNPNSSNKSVDIENRLSNIFQLIEQMEPEHVGFTFKIAFSPIYGNTKFGESIINGASHETLLEWYDQLFDKYEAYRKTTVSS